LVIVVGNIAPDEYSCVSQLSDQSITRRLVDIKAADIPPFADKITGKATTDATLAFN